MKKTLVVLAALLMAMTCILVSCGDSAAGNHPDAVSAAGNHPDAVRAAEDLNDMLGNEVEADTNGMMKAYAEAKGTGVVVVMEIDASLVPMLQESGVSFEDLMSELFLNPFSNGIREDYPALDYVTVMLKDSDGKVHYEKTYNR